MRSARGTLAQIAVDRRRVVLADIARREWLLSVMALAAAGCRRAEDRAYARGNTLIVAVRDVSVILPDATDLDFLIFLPLTEENERGELEGRLAERWEHSADYQENTFYLRRDVQWHDGPPVTAHDVKFSLGLLSHPDVRERPPCQSVTVLDDFAIRIARVGYVDGTGIVFWPRHHIQHLDPKRFWEWEFWKQPVGNGPFRFVRYVPETMMEFEANLDSYRGKPKIDRVVLKFVGKAGLNELLAGNVDIVLGADMVQIPRVLKDRRFRVVQEVAPGAWAIFWKNSHPLFRDPRVRRALTMAIDRRELMRLLYLSDELPITDGVMTPRQLRRREFPEALPYDPRQAGALLDASGWGRHDVAGLRERDGRPFQFTAIVRNDVVNLAVYVQAQLERLGVRMELQVLDSALVWSKLDAGDFEAAFSIHRPWSEDQARHFGRNNPTGYRNPEAFQVIDELRATADPDETERLNRRLSDIFRADPPVTRLILRTPTHFVHRRVRGLSTPFRAEPDRFMGDLWIEDEPAAWLPDARSFTRSPVGR